MRANAGPDQTIVRGRPVTLDAGATIGADTYSWTQVSGPAVTLSSTAAVRPTFTYPLQALPAVPGPNPGFVYTNAPIVFDLTATGPGGTDVDRVVIRPAPETLSGITARWRTRGEWRISGTSSLLAGQRLAVILGNNAATGRVLGITTVDTAGAFSLRATTPAPGTATVLSIITATGERVTNVPFTVTS
jgi:hypothetical protein